MKPESLTIVSTCKPFIGDDAIRQRNSIISWITAVKPQNVLLVGDEPGVAEISEEFGLMNDKEVDRIDGRLPSLQGVLDSPSLRDSPFVCYVNADVILPANTTDVLERVARQMSQFMIVGERWNIDLLRPIKSTEIADRSLETFARQHGRLPGPHWVDYFIYPQGLLGEIPRLAIAGGLWDHWLVGRALQQGASVVDATSVLTAIHQEHQRPDANAAESRWTTNLEVIGDQRMLRTIADATHSLATDGGITNMSARRRIVSRTLRLVGPLSRLTRPFRRRLGLNLDTAYRLIRR